MAIQVTLDIATAKEKAAGKTRTQTDYVKIVEITGVKEAGILTLNYKANHYNKKDEFLLKSVEGAVGYKGGDAWAESYADLKTKYDEFIDI